MTKEELAPQLELYFAADKSKIYIDAYHEDFPEKEASLEIKRLGKDKGIYPLADIIEDSRIFLADQLIKET